MAQPISTRTASATLRRLTFHLLPILRRPSSPFANTTYAIVSVSNLATSCMFITASANIDGSAVLTMNPLPTTSISGTASICAGDSPTLTFTLSAGTYHVVYTDGRTNFNANG